MLVLKTILVATLAGFTVWLMVLLFAPADTERLAWGPIEVIGAPLDPAQELIGQRVPLIEGRDDRDRPVLLDRDAAQVVVFADVSETSSAQVMQLRRWRPIA